VEPAVKSGLRFEVDLEGADPWTLSYPDVIPLYVAVGSVEEPKTFGDMMGPEGLKDPLWLYEGWPEEARPKPIAGPDDFESAYYDLDYRSEKGNLSKWLRVTYRDGSVKDIRLDDIRPDQPKLTAAKAEALRIMDDYNALFILGAFPTVFFLLTMATSIDPAAPNPTPRYTARRVTLRKPSKTPVDPEKGVVTNDPVKPAGTTEPPPATAATQSPQAARAHQLTAEIAGKGEPVIVNIGGAGARHEPQNAINLNNQAVARKDIPNLVEADGAQIGELFPAGKVDRVEGHNMAPGVVDWTRGAPGAYKVLKPGGKFSYAYRGANSDAKVLASELEKAGFTDVKNIADVLVTATKP
jgi:hypothetical protein